MQIHLRKETQISERYKIIFLIMLAAVAVCSEPMTRVDEPNVEPVETIVSSVSITPKPTSTPKPTKKPTSTPKPTPKPTRTPTPTPKLKLIGTFRATGYCPCRKCCGKYGGKKTASGTRPKAGRTISTDPRVIKTGTHIIINGKEYIAEDTGSAIKGKRIDIFFNTHKEASKFGVKKIKVYRKVK